MSAALQQVLDATRQRFVATFVAQCDSLRILVDQVVAIGPTGPIAALTQVTHRLSGLAGTIGFPTISLRASELERLIDGAAGGGFDAVHARGAVEAIRDAFLEYLASPPAWALPAVAAPRGATILLAEDEPDQCAIVKTCLVGAGYALAVVVSGDLVVAAARAQQPALILLDIAMPRLDGY